MSKTLLETMIDRAIDGEDAFLVFMPAGELFPAGEAMGVVPPAGNSDEPKLRVVE
jgi:hypothetical protein